MGNLRVTASPGWKRVLATPTRAFRAKLNPFLLRPVNPWKTGILKCQIGQTA
jgi:hypothetical protein